FDQGGVVPHDMLAMVHKDEMVLPKDISQPLQSSLAEGGGIGGGGGHTFNVQPHFQGKISKADMHRQTAEFAKSLKSHMRYGGGR
ncbi:MAG: hypothetical protein ACRD5L_09650, partial [Bryobacteraceae bacterium]